ncbi:MAG: DUF4089 domain-containing protein [Hyphomicrobiaceae bacterium]
MDPSQDTLDALIAANAALLGLVLAPEWRATVRQSLAVSFRLAALVEDIDLPDEAEPAPVFEA